VLSGPSQAVVRCEGCHLLLLWANGRVTTSSRVSKPTNIGMPLPPRPAKPGEPSLTALQPETEPPTAKAPLKDPTGGTRKEPVLRESTATTTARKEASGPIRTGATSKPMVPPRAERRAPSPAPPQAKEPMAAARREPQAAAPAPSKEGAGKPALVAAVAEVPQMPGPMVDPSAWFDQGISDVVTPERRPDVEGRASSSEGKWDVAPLPPPPAGVPTPRPLDLDHLDDNATPPMGNAEGMPTPAPFSAVSAPRAPTRAPASPTLFPTRAPAPSSSTAPPPAAPTRPAAAPPPTAAPPLAAPTLIGAPAPAPTLTGAPAPAPTLMGAPAPAPTLMGAPAPAPAVPVARANEPVAEPARVALLENAPALVPTLVTGRPRPIRALGLGIGAGVAVVMMLVVVFGRGGKRSPAPAPTTAAAPPTTEASPTSAAPSEPAAPAVEPPQVPEPPAPRAEETQRPRRTLGGKKVVLEYDPKPSSPAPPPAQAATPNGESPAALAGARDAYHKGNVKLFNGDPAGAIVLYSQALKLYPGYVAGYRGLGLGFEAAGDREGALKAFRTYLKTVPNAHDAALIKHRIERLEQQNSR
jgi:hypothetical protein